MAETGDPPFSQVLSVLISGSSYRNARGALAAEIGVSPSAISQYLSGASLPRIDVLARLAKALQVSTDYLIFGSERNLRLSREQSFLQARLDDFLSSHTASRDRREWLRLELARRLEARIDRAIDEEMPAAVEDAAIGAGFLRDEEVRQIESLSTEVVVVSTTLKYNVTLDASETYRPGPFADTVVDGILEGRSYTFVIPSGEPLRSAAEAMVGIFRDLVDRDLGEQVRVLVTDVPLVGGFLLYRFDAAGLARTNPYLMEKVEAFTTGSTLGLMANTSDLVAGDMILDREHLARAERLVGHIAGAG